MSSAGNVGSGAAGRRLEVGSDELGEDPKAILDEYAQAFADGTLTTETFIARCGLGGIGFYLSPGKGDVRVHKDASSAELSDFFKGVVRGALPEIQRCLKSSLGEGRWKLTPEQVTLMLSDYDKLNASERQHLYNAALRLGVLSASAKRPWEQAPVLHETEAERRKRETLEYIADLEDGGSCEWSWDPGPGIAWVECLYPDGRVSRHFFIRHWWEGKPEDQCDCEWQKFHPKQKCKHSRQRLREWERRQKGKGR